MSDGLNREGFTEPRAAHPLDGSAEFEDGPYAGLSPYGIAVTALERILELDSGWTSWDEARGIASEAATLAVAASKAEHAAGTCDEHAPKPAPELAAAMAETRELRELVTDMLTAFTVTGSGHSARVGQVQIAKWRKRAGLPE